MVADGDRLDSGADRLDDADGLVAEQHGPRPVQHPVDVVQVAVAQPGRECAHRDLTRAGRVDLDLGDDEVVASVVEQCGDGHGRTVARGRPPTARSTDLSTPRISPIRYRFGADVTAGDGATALRRTGLRPTDVAALRTLGDHRTCS